MSLILTQAGLAALAEAESTGSKVQATHMAVGDGDGATPEHTAASTALDNETWRGALQSITINEQGETRGWAASRLRGPRPYDRGRLVHPRMRPVRRRRPPGHRPAPDPLQTRARRPDEDGAHHQSRRDLRNADAVSLIVDPAVVLASQEHVATKVAEHNADATSHADIRDEIDAMAEAMENDTHAARTDNPHATTKAHVGLGNLPMPRAIP